MVTYKFSTDLYSYYIINFTVMHMRLCDISQHAYPLWYYNYMIIRHLRMSSFKLLNIDSLWIIEMSYYFCIFSQRGQPDGAAATEPDSSASGTTSTNPAASAASAAPPTSKPPSGQQAASGASTPTSSRRRGGLTSSNSSPNYASPTQNSSRRSAGVGAPASPSHNAG